MQKIGQKIVKTQIHFELVIGFSEKGKYLIKNLLIEHNDAMCNFKEST